MTPEDHIKGQTQKDSNQLVMSFKAVRQFLGVLGLALPISLLLYAFLTNTALEPSISDFYHTPMGDVLVGVLCAIGVFLLTYKGYEPDADEWITDRRVSVAAGLGAIGVAVFPVFPQPAKVCPPPEFSDMLDYFCPNTGFTQHPNFMHFGSAGLFFACLALFCLVLFPKAQKKNMTKIEGANIKIYKTCGYLILLSLALLVGTFLGVRFGGPDIQDKILDWKLIFWFEVLGVVAFAISWLTKGKTIGSIKSKIQARAT